MSNKTKVLLFCLAIGLLVLFILFTLATLLLKPSPLDENNARTYALDYIKSEPRFILKEEEADIKDVTIQKRNGRGRLQSSHGGPLAEAKQETIRRRCRCRTARRAGVSSVRRCG